jgi:hypothetical protein
MLCQEQHESTTTATREAIDERRLTVERLRFEPPEPPAAFREAPEGLKRAPATLEQREESTVYHVCAF